MLFQRMVAVLIGAPIVLASLFCPLPWVFKVLVQICLSAALLEFFALVSFSKRERLFAASVGTLHSLFLMFGPGGAWVLPEVILVVMVGFFFFLLHHPAGLDGIASRLGLFVLGQFYLATLGAMVGLVRSLSHGVFFVLILLGMTWLNDTFAYFFGHRWGRRRLSPTVSPGKSVEGLLGGFLGSLCGFTLFWLTMENPLRFYDGLVLAFLCGLCGPVGDLGESLIKRSFHVKDSGTLIPGHGGMLDRIDALLFTAPVVYYYARCFGF